jgi:hypothetical protein
MFALLPIIEYSLEFSFQSVDSMSHLMFAENVIQAGSYNGFKFVKFLILWELSQLKEGHMRSLDIYKILTTHAQDVMECL